MGDYGMGVLVSLLIVTRNRSDDLAEAIQNVESQTHRPLEIVVVENGSDQETIARNTTFLHDRELVRHVILDTNRGVSGGRNAAVQEARGTVIVELDDDAVFDDPRSLTKVVEVLDEHSQAGILAFQIRNYYSGRVERHEFPFRDKRRDPGRSGYCTWFIGAGHAFRRSVLDVTGLYRDFAPWGSEEQDLSFRALDAGIDLWYAADIIVLHKKSPTARMPDIKFASIAVKNRVKAAALNLPWRSVVTYFAVRAFQLALKYRNFTIPFRALALLRRDLGYIRKHRKKLKPATLERLKELRGQLYY